VTSLEQATTPVSSRHRSSDAGGQSHTATPLVSIIVPAYNEAALLEQNLAILCRYMRTLESEYRWEVIVVNDGSSDATASLAEEFARSWTNVRVAHHRVNGGLGRALRTAVGLCDGDYVVVLDLDLSYSPGHIERLLKRLRETDAKIVVASPYMKGGRVSNVPWLRRVLSTWANRFLSVAVKGSISTVTGMVRAYDGPFLRSLDLASTGMDINPEIIHKTLMLKGRVEEMPAHLDWQLQVAVGARRTSSIRMLSQVTAVLLAGYLFRPVMFFIVPGLVVLAVAVYANVWLLIHFVNHWLRLPQYTWAFSRASAAVADAYHQAPHTFFVGLMGLVLAIQLLSLGILALQSQRYFEQIFHLGTTLYRRIREDE
jgi:glycosyltransferase involved in cell wall biosynthesis